MWQRFIRNKKGRFMKDILWYKKPAAYWDEALPVGNGRLGAMVYGQIAEERIQLNEESFWSGAPTNRINPDASGQIKEIQKLVMEKEVPRAQELALMALSGTPQSQRSYQTLGELRIFQEAVSCTDYRRELNLNDAVVRTGYTQTETVFTQEVFTSKPDDCIVIRRRAEGDGRLRFRCRFDRKQLIDHAFAVDDHTISYDFCNGGMWFSGVLSAAADAGKVRTTGEFLQVDGAKEVTLIFSAVTSYRSKCPFEDALSIVRKAEKHSFESLYEAHRKDYQELYGRVKLNFGEETENCVHDETNNAECMEIEKTAKMDIPTDERLEQMKKDDGEPDAGLLELYFQFGRYLMISGSRPGGLPLTLQGLWNADITPPWGSRYTVNINLQMNYWPVDVCNLSECGEPFFELLKRVVKSGQITARGMYQCRGFVVHHNTDLYADTAPQDHYIPASYWVMGGGWLATHVWEHYVFTKDVEFLKNYFEILREAVVFYRDFLMEDEQGRLLICPSVSPENSYYTETGASVSMCAGATMDTEILQELLEDYLAAAKVLGMEDALAEDVRTMKGKLPELRTGKHGQLMEWLEDYEEAEPGHRHISHLYGVFPGNQIDGMEATGYVCNEKNGSQCADDLEDSEKLAKAAKTSLERRLQYGGGHTGWSCAWIILLWSRFGDADKAYENLIKLLTQSTFSNLMDAHPFTCERGRVFQIDGNMGAITAICEMLVQSQNNRVVLLPALPKQLATGQVQGIRIRGNAEISMEWREGRLVYLELYARSDFCSRLYYKGYCLPIRLRAGERKRIEEKSFLRCRTN